MSDLTFIELRRIEASIVKPIYDEMLAELGEEQARAILERAIANNAIEQARALAEESKPASLDDFVNLLGRWTADDALVMEVLERDAEKFSFNVTRCRYAEMYREMGLGEIGHLLSCNRDGAFCEGYDERLELSRTQTLMGGSSHCDFRYRYRQGRT